MPNIEINLRPAKVLAVGIIVIHIGALVCVLCLDVSVWLKLILMAIIVANSYYILRRILLRSSKSIVKIWHKENNTWYLLNKAGKLVQSQLRSSYVARYIIILNFKYSVILCGQGELKDLRVYLAMQG